MGTFLLIIYLILFVLGASSSLYLEFSEDSKAKENFRETFGLDEEDNGLPLFFGMLSFTLIPLGLIAIPTYLLAKYVIEGLFSNEK